MELKKEDNWEIRMVILVTGKSGSGKSFYARHLAYEMESAGKAVKLIDGDVWRQQTHNRDFTDDGRLENLLSAAKQAQSYEEQGFTVVMAFICPKKIWRVQMRSMWLSSRLVYIPGGTLWEGTEYEMPDEKEFYHVLNMR